MSAKSVPDVLKALPPHPHHLSATFLAGKGFEILFASYSSGTTIAPHRHDTVNLGVITAGEIILDKQGREDRYRAGDWYEIPSGMVHSSRFECDTTSVELSLERDGQEGGTRTGT